MQPSSVAASAPLLLLLPWLRPLDAALAPMAKGKTALGFDFGTSGARCALIAPDGKLLCPQWEVKWGAKERVQSAADWNAALDELMTGIPDDARRDISRIAVSGTSSTVLLCDARTGLPVEDRGLPRMYDFSVTKQAPNGCGSRAMDLISSHAPPAHVVRAPTSTLAKVLAWDAERPLEENERIVHQADYIAAQLCSAEAAESAFVSDWHNALKLGFDVQTLEYPEWLVGGPIGDKLRGKLPRVIRPGGAIGCVSAAAAERWGLAAECVVTAGSTDSISAFLASGVSEVGDAVTSLGSTLAIKMLSEVPVTDAARGVYSHRLGQLWLVGGASNVGCAVLREQGFSADELKELSLQIDVNAEPAEPGYYPLPQATVGERFPRADDGRTAVLSPVPPRRADFLHSILHAIGAVEAEGYAALKELGASPLKRVLTCGGGASNDAWMQMRQRMLGVPTARAEWTDAAVGVALLAARGTDN